MKQQLRNFTIRPMDCLPIQSAGWAALVLCIMAADVPAATWTVEKDGSGDFSVIQDALNAAESGDTIQIGVGQFEESFTYQFPGGLEEAHCFASQDAITILGAGESATIIGSATGPGTQDHPIGILSDVNTRLNISDLTVENCSSGIQANGPAIFVSDCTLRACDIGLDILSWDGIHVEGSSFFDNDDGIIVFQGLGAKDVIINDCHFLGGLTSVVLQSDNNLVSNCTFDGLYSGVNFQFGAWGTIRNCQFRNLVGQGVIAGTGASVELLNSQFEVADVNISVAGSTLTGSGNVLMGGTFYTINLSASATVDFQNNHIFNAGGVTVNAPGSPTRSSVYDLRNNYWGTPDAAQIAEWIFDGADTGRDSVVLFEPFHGMPVSTERTSFGALKATFGPSPD